MLDSTPVTPAWMPTGLPARLTAREAAKLLGFTEDEIRYLVRQKHLKPLGQPRQQQTKYFSTAYLAKLMGNEAWLNKATALGYQGNRTKTRGGEERLAA
jgi:hypothetical protein